MLSGFSQPLDIVAHRSYTEWRGKTPRIIFDFLETAELVLRNPCFHGGHFDRDTRDGHIVDQVHGRYSAGKRLVLEWDTHNHGWRCIE